MNGSVDTQTQCQATNVDQARFIGVPRSSAPFVPEGTPPAYQVEAPRASDVLALALRDAYSRDVGLPDDMVAILRRLNRSEAGAH